MATLLRILLIAGRYVKYLPSLIGFIVEVVKLYRKINHKPKVVVTNKEIEEAKKTKDTSKLEFTL